MRFPLVFGLAVAGLVLLSSCVVLRGPAEVVGQVLKSGTRVAEKAATTSIDVAGEAAKSAIRREERVEGFLIETAPPATR